jgi:hypothetical protein
MTSFQQRRAEALVHLPHIRSSVQQLADLIDRIKDLRQPDGTDYGRARRHLVSVAAQ